MKRKLPILASALLAGCSSLAPDAAFVAATRKYHQVVSKAIVPLTDQDASNDPDLSGSTGQSIRLQHDAMEVALERAEAALAEAAR